MNTTSLRLIIHVVITTTLALCDIGAMEAIESSPPEIIKITIGGKILNSMDMEANFAWLRLSPLPDEIGKLTKLKKLHLSCNQLITLPSAIGSLTELTELYLSGNHLTTLLPEIGSLTALTTLSLSNNHLPILPPEIGNITTLTELYLSGNQLRALPSMISNLTNLKKLYLGYNQLTTIPVEVGSLTALRELYINGNPLIEGESKWAKRIDYSTELDTLRLYCTTKKDVEIKFKLLILATQVDAGSSLANLLPDVIDLLCALYFHHCLGNFL